MKCRYPALYPILDAQALAARGLRLTVVAEELVEAGVPLIQYRNKSGDPQELLNAASSLTAVLAGTSVRLILNDRADLAQLAGCGGVHVGQKDLSPADARLVLGSESLIGVSTHGAKQVIEANLTTADYVAIGPVFGTTTKLDAEPVVGLAGVREARSLTTKPLVAIGGITRDNARSVRDAGADLLAVIGALFVPGESPGKVARDFLEILR